MELWKLCLTTDVFPSFHSKKYLEPVAIIRLAYPGSWLGRQKLYVILGQEMTFKKDILFKTLNSEIVDVD